MVGKTGDPFREERRLKIACSKCHQKPLVIAERNWEATNDDHSQRYQIVVACLNCGFVDEFEVNVGQENKIGRLKYAKIVPTPADLAE